LDECAAGGDRARSRRSALAMPLVGDATTQAELRISELGGLERDLDGGRPQESGAAWGRRPDSGAMRVRGSMRQDHRVAAHWSVVPGAGAQAVASGMSGRNQEEEQEQAELDCDPMASVPGHGFRISWV
jgi:hypothetical protein